MAKILIVDDDPDWLQRCEKALAERGHETYSTSDPRDAINQIRYGNFFGMVSDVQIGHDRKAGIDLAREAQGNDMPYCLWTHNAYLLEEVQSLQRPVVPKSDDPGKSQYNFDTIDKILTRGISFTLQTQETYSPNQRTS
ncbi:MAG: hypothetical protein ABIC04_07640 [Nanoarchaeota archaeon]